jgi:hypothetical protein
MKWRPGPRSALLPADSENRGGSGRTLLQVSNVDTRRGGLRLGKGDYTLTYPVGPDSAQYERGQLVALHRNNHLARVDRRRPPAAGDTALLGWYGGRLRILGLHGTKVRLAERNERNWPGAGWLYDALAGAEQADTIAAFREALPVTLEGPDEDGTVTVSRRLQPTSALTHRGLLRLEATAVLGSRLVLRCGPSLHCLPVTDVVPGVPEQHVEDVARALVARRREVWLQVAGAPGRPPRIEARFAVPDPRPYSDEFDALPLVAVGPAEASAGLLVRTPHDQGYRWLPASLLSWAGRLSGAEIASAFLAAARPLRVRLQNNGAVSAVGVRHVWRARQDLALGTRLRVEPVRTAAPGDKTAAAVSAVAAGTLAFAQPYGMLVRLVQNRHDRTRDESLSAEVAVLDTADARGVQVVPVGSRLLVLDLPERVATGTASDSAERHAADLERHGRWLAEGWSAADSRTLLPPAETPDAAVLRAWPATVPAGQLPGPGRDDDASARRPDVRRALTEWLSHRGDEALGLTRESDLELAPAVAACLLMAHCGKEDQVFARGAVLLAHQLGLRAGRSLHVEPLARTWAGTARSDTGPEATRNPLDLRLAALHLPAAVDRTGLEHILRFGHGVLGRVDADAQANPLDGTARAVLAAVGHLTPDMDLRKDAPVLSGLANLARALHPPRDEAVAQQSLCAPQLEALAAVLIQSTREAPLSLLPVPGRLSGPAHRLARQVLDNAKHSPSPE